MHAPCREYFMKQTLKKIITTLAGIMPVGFWAFCEHWSAYVQGKGSGSDFLAGEAVAAVHALHGDNLIIFDIGANQGDWSREILLRLGSRVDRLLQFEPSPHNVAFLKKKFANTQCAIVPSAVSDRPGSAVLYSEEPGSGTASLHKRRLEHFGTKSGDPLNISTVTVDDVIKDRQIDRVDFMKMDIEGHELAALHGAEQSLRSGIIKALSFEFGGCDIDSKTYFQDFWYYLTPLNYRIFRILPSGALFPIVKYTESLEFFGTTNYIAVLSQK